MDFSHAFHPTMAVMSFFGGWCGTVPISVIIWWLIHHGKIPPPPPEPWWRRGLAGAVGGLVLGSIINATLADAATVTSLSILQSGLTGIIAGAVIGSFALKGQVSNMRG